MSQVTLSESNHFELITDLMAMGRYALSIKQIDLALSRDGPSSMLLAMLSVCQASLGEHDKALSTAKHSLALSPDNAYAHYAVSFSALKLGELREAMDSILAAIELNPSKSNYRALYGSLLAADQKLEKAISEAELGMELNPQCVACHVVRLKCLVRQNSKVEVSKAVHDLLRISPENPFAHLALGWLNAKDRNVDKMLQNFETSLSLAPDQIPLSQNLFFLKLAQTNPLFRPVFLIYFIKRRLKSFKFLLPPLLVFCAIQAQLILVTPDDASAISVAIGSSVIYLISVAIWFVEAIMILVLRINRKTRHLVSKGKRRINTALLVLCLVVLSGLGSQVIAWINEDSGVFWGAILVVSLGTFISIPLLPNHLRSPTQAQHG